MLRHLGTGLVARPRPELVVHFPHYDLGSKLAWALLLDDYRLVRHYEDDRCELLDLARDVEERHDLAAKDPERAAELRARLENYLRAIGAGMPKAAAAAEGSGKPRDGKR